MLDKLKTLLGIDATDTSQDTKLQLLVQMAAARLKILLGGIDPPEEMEHIILEASVVRFNRIGSEGLSSHTVEGESLAFSESDFDGFASEIQAFLESQDKNTRGRVRFL